MDKLLGLFVGVLCVCCVCGELKIKELSVPGSVELGKTEEVILDCNYEGGEEEKDVELKWFYNGDTEIIYQWIPDSNKPGYAMGRLKDHIDLDYSISDDKLTMYRAVKITDVNPELSGNYTCKVSSLLSEVTETKQLIVYSPAAEGLDIMLIDDEEQKMVVCTASGISPKPLINLYIARDNDTKVEIEEEVIEDTDSDGLYNITTTHNFNPKDHKDLTKFVCNLTIPGTNYTLIETVDYQEVLEIISEEDYYVNLNDTNTNNNSTLDYELNNSTTEEYIDKNITNKEENSASVPLSSIYLSTLLLILLLSVSK